MGAIDDKRSCSCDMRSEVLEYLEVFRGARADFDVDGRRFGPFEVRERAIEVGAGLEPEAGPEEWAGYEGEAPIPTDVRGGDQIIVAVAMFKNPRQDLWWEPVAGRERVHARPGRL